MASDTSALLSPACSTPLTILSMEDRAVDASEIKLEEIHVHGAPYRPPQQQPADYNTFDGWRVNASILGHSPSDYPSTAWDLLVPRHQRLNKLLCKIKTRPDAFRVDLQVALYERQLAPNFPPGPASSEHVYVVTTPHVPREVSRRHWSVYHQGYFYHLSARVPKKSTEQGDTSGLVTKGAKAEVTLKVEDLSTVDSEDYIKAQRTASRKPFAAYEVGATQYNPQQLRSLAQYIITELATYDLLKANCQVFAIELIERAVMFRRDCSVFVGNKTQLVDWDLRGRCGDDELARCPNNIQRGFLIRQPTFPSRWSIRPRMWFYVLFPVSGTKLRCLRTLYEEGPYATYAMDPEGKYGPWIWPWVILKRDKFFKDMPLYKQWWRRSTREFYEDMKAGRFKSAFLGRDETTKEFEAALRHP